jgi:tRNA (uracil-5-)-methyltransferase
MATVAAPVSQAAKAAPIANGQKRARQGGPPPKRQKTKKEKPVKEGSNQEVLVADVRELLASLTVSSSTTATDAVPTATPEDTRQDELPTKFTEIDVKIHQLSSTGDGLGTSASSDQIYVVPFSVPGDTVKAKVITHFTKEHYSLADFVAVVEPSPLRDDTRIGCKYFAKCSGCQFQMLDYADQLAHKKTIVEKAYKNFSQLSPDVVPAVRDTMGSPLIYGYRTKLTPHFDGPPGHRSRENRRSQEKKMFETTPDIGFQQKGLSKTIDIEDCPIGTDAVRQGMKRERKRVAAELGKYTRGATILLRENTKRVAKAEVSADEPVPNPEEVVRVESDRHVDIKSCITDNNAVSTEYIDNFVFTNPAGAFFQNNNSILPSFTQYIRDHVMPPKGAAGQINHLIDAYCGSGLFTITLSALFKSSMGIDISGASTEYARKNATLNGIPDSQATFIAADAPELFKSVQYPADETVVIIDPPRKGCDESFLNQLMKFKPKRVVYVSCNVHTQARDVGVLVRGKEGVSYDIESLRGFDFFPQTSHVEGVAVLNRKDTGTVDTASS